MTHILVVEGRFYEDVSALLRAGAEAEIKRQHVTADFIGMPGALEIPAAIARAADKKIYDGFVALGCVIKGETSHYEIVAHLSAWGLMRLAVDRALAIGNGILTVENRAQAEARASLAGEDKGGSAVRACLALIRET